MYLRDTSLSERVKYLVKWYKLVHLMSINSIKVRNLN